MVGLTRRLAAAVAPGGTLLVVGHHPADLATGVRHGHASFTGKPMEIQDSVLRARRRGEVG
jgi:hypothetical protein